MFCCFSQKPNLDTQINNTNTNEDKCVRISSPRLLETRSIYDSIKLDTKWDDTKHFIPPIERGVVIKVYDGDTITIASKLPYDTSELFRFQIRLAGIDCPEMKSQDENEKECAQIAKQVLSELVLHKMVTLSNIETEKYGRILATVYLDDVNINDLLLKKRLAVSYDGGKKMSPKNWLDYYYNNIMN